MVLTISERAASYCSWSRWSVLAASATLISKVKALLGADLIGFDLQVPRILADQHVDVFARRRRPPGLGPVAKEIFLFFGLVLPLQIVRDRGKGLEDDFDLKRREISESRRLLHWPAWRRTRPDRSPSARRPRSGREREAAGQQANSQNPPERNMENLPCLPAGRSAGRPAATLQLSLLVNPGTVILFSPGALAGYGE